MSLLQELKIKKSNARHALLKLLDELREVLASDLSLDDKRRVMYETHQNLIENRLYLIHEDAHRKMQHPMWEGWITPPSKGWANDRERENELAPLRWLAYCNQLAELLDAPPIRVGGVVTTTQLKVVGIGLHRRDFTLKKEESPINQFAHVCLTVSVLMDGVSCNVPPVVIASSIIAHPVKYDLRYTNSERDHLRRIGLMESVANGTMTYHDMTSQW